MFDFCGKHQEHFVNNSVKHTYKAYSIPLSVETDFSFLYMFSSLMYLGAVEANSSHLEGFLQASRGGPTP